MSRYHGNLSPLAIRPGSLLGRSRREIDWIKPWDQVYAKVDGLDRWFVGAECNTCWNAVDRHVEAGHGARTALIYDSPLTGTKQTLHLCRAAGRSGDARRRARRSRRRQGRSRPHLYADDPAGGLRHAGLRADRRHSFGGVRRLRSRPNLPPASTMPSPNSSCRPPAASSPGASSPTSRCSTRRSNSPTHKPDAGLVWQRPRANGRSHARPRP